jgi:hypothetical protein
MDGTTHSLRIEAAAWGRLVDGDPLGAGPEGDMKSVGRSRTLWAETPYCATALIPTQTASGVDRGNGPTWSTHRAPILGRIASRKQHNGASSRGADEVGSGGAHAGDGTPRPGASDVEECHGVRHP